jgi:hypothetical protein
VNSKSIAISCPQFESVLNGYVLSQPSEQPFSFQQEGKSRWEIFTQRGQHPVACRNPRRRKEF